MAKERIIFPEEFIPEIIRVIRVGLQHVTVCAEVREQLGKQCDDLEAYAKRNE